MVIRAIPCAAILMLATPVVAKSPQDQMFPDSGSCYARTYTAEHLAAHPKQQVTDIAVKPDFDFAKPLLALYLTMALRNVPGDDFETYSACENEGEKTLYCTLEGDAGAFKVTPTKEGAILIEVSRRGMTLENDKVFATIKGRAGDDRSFLLQASACPQVP
jgi:hypothetical protein